MTTTLIITAHTLAASKRGGTSVHHTHAIIESTGEPLCRKVKAASLGIDPNHADAAPSCPICRKRDPRMIPTPGLVAIAPYSWGKSDNIAGAIAIAKRHVPSFVELPYTVVVYHVPHFITVDGMGRIRYRGAEPKEVSRRVITRRPRTSW